MLVPRTGLPLAGTDIRGLQWPRDKSGWPWASPPHKRVSQQPDPFREGGFTVKLGGASPAQGMVNFESGPLWSVSDQQKALALGNRVYVVTGLRVLRNTRSWPGTRHFYMCQPCCSDCHCHPLRHNTTSQLGHTPSCQHGSKAMTHFLPTPGLKNMTHNSRHLLTLSFIQMNGSASVAA